MHPGVQHSSGFRLHPSGDLAFAIDHLSRNFIKIGLGPLPGQQIAITTGQPTFDIKIACDIHIAVVQRSSNDFICAVFVSKEGKKKAGKIFIVTYTFDSGNIVVIDQQYIHADGLKTTKIDFELDEKEGFIWCYALHRIERNRTVLRATKIEVSKLPYSIHVDCFLYLLITKRIMILFCVGYLNA